MRTLLALMFVASCGLSNPDDQVSITQGVYGRTISGCDTSPCSDSAAADMIVHVASKDGLATAATTSDGGGFFELTVPPGNYALCVTFHEGGETCTDIDAPAGRLRADWVSGPGGGVWCVETGCQVR